MAKISMPKWLTQGVLYGTTLGAVCYTVGAIAVNAIPAAFPANFDVILSAIGFTSAVGISYTNDINQDKEEK